MCRESPPSQRNIELGRVFQENLGAGEKTNTKRVRLSHASKQIWVQSIIFRFLTQFGWWALHLCSCGRLSLLNFSRPSKCYASDINCQRIRPWCLLLSVAFFPSLYPPSDFHSYPRHCSASTINSPAVDLNSFKHAALPGPLLCRLWDSTEHTTCTTVKILYVTQIRDIRGPLFFLCFNSICIMSPFLPLPLSLHGDFLFIQSWCVWLFRPCPIRTNTLVRALRVLCYCWWFSDVFSEETNTFWGISPKS